MAEWQFVAANGAQQIDLTAATGRKLTARLWSPSEASFTIDGRNEQATVLMELATDLLVRRNGVDLYRGRVGATSDSIGADTHSVDVPTGDYRALLLRRLLYDDDELDWTGDQSDIVWGLVEATQARAGGDLGITRGVGAVTGVSRTVDYEPGASIGEAVQQLAQLDDGFEWDISPALELDVYYPQRGQVGGETVVLDYGGLVSGVQRNVDPGNYANALRVTGDAALTPEVREAADLATRPEGRWDAQVGLTTIQQQPLLAARADWLLGVRQVVTPSYTLQLRPGGWEGPAHVWLGDTCRLSISSGRLAVDTLLRVVEVSVDLPGDGDEVVSLTLGSARQSMGGLLADNLLRLGQLERT